jgi:toxin YoeB
VKREWSDQAWEDYEHWHRTDVAIWKLINALIGDIREHPERGLGRPKALQLDLKGWWSRRITDEDRLVYRVRGRGRKSVLEILQCRGHYGRRR